MTILEILPQFLKEEKIRRDSWDKNAYIYKEGVYFHFVYNNNGASGDDIRYLSDKIFALDDLMGNDWHNVLAKPKFKVGDWIVDNEDKSVSQITQIVYSKVETDFYGYNHTNGYFANDFEKDYHLWTIQDAKSGDVLMCESGWTCIFKELDLDNNTFSSYCFMATDLDFMPYGGKCHTLDSRINGEITPATEQQRNLFFKKMKKAGYQWDADKKELRKTIKPNFKVGDWIVSNTQPAIIHELKPNYYLGKYLNGHDFCHKYTDEDKLHLWTIEDANDGDILYFDDYTIVIFKDLYNSSTFHSYCHIEDGVFDISKEEMPDWWEGKGFKPATKEQRDLLFAKMKEAGYVWDSDKKELQERK